jgi:hypothetical protein
MKKAGLKISDGVAEAMKAVEESELMRNVSPQSPIVVVASLNSPFRLIDRKSLGSRLFRSLQRYSSRPKHRGLQGFG